MPCPPWTCDPIDEPQTDAQNGVSWSPPASVDDAANIEQSFIQQIEELKDTIRSKVSFLLSENRRLRAALNKCEDEFKSDVLSKRRMYPSATSSVEVPIAGSSSADVLPLSRVPSLKGDRSAADEAFPGEISVADSALQADDSTRTHPMGAIPRLMSTSRFTTSAKPSRKTAVNRTRLVWTEIMSLRATEQREDDMNDDQTVTEAIGASGLVPYRRMSTHSAAKRSFVQKLIVNPASKRCVLWQALTLLFLAYDVSVAPIDVCFPRYGQDGSGFDNIMKQISRIFWTLDVVATFLTGFYSDGGVVVMDSVAIALKYAKGWLLFDASLVGAEWIFLILLSLRQASMISMLHGLRLARVWRVLRLIRVMRIVKLQTVLKSILPDNVNAVVGVFHVGIVLILFLHLGACLWALMGDSDGGWMHRHYVVNEPLFRQYVIAINWMLMSMQGSRGSSMSVELTAELVYDSVICFCSLILVCCLVAAFSASVSMKAQSELAKMKNIATGYFRTHNIAVLTRLKTQRFLREHHGHRPGEVINCEAKLFKELPAQLQVDLHYESRAPLLSKINTFLILHSLTTRCVRHICDEFENRLAVEEETVFSKGDHCDYTYVVSIGVFKYICDEHTLSATPRPDAFPRREDCGSGYDILHTGQCLSEAALWTEWEHKGDLLPIREDGLLLALKVQTFIAVVSRYSAVRVQAATYAKIFTARLHACLCCDITGFDFDMADLDVSFFTGSPDEHFLFLSHYKVEAGTEATLMRDLLLNMIASDPSHDANHLPNPIFVDSEDLVDLVTLRYHVENCANVVILLTPAVLTRPWCLLEIVTAVRSEVQVVPVEVQRPGLKYIYPDDEWYSELRRGRVLSDGDLKVLSREGITLEEVEQAVRKVFLNIALPFSPHKSGNVRAAELQDILRRCQTLQRTPTSPKLA